MGGGVLSPSCKPLIPPPLSADSTGAEELFSLI